MNKKEKEQKQNWHKNEVWWENKWFQVNFYFARARPHAQLLRKVWCRHTTPSSQIKSSVAIQKYALCSFAILQRETKLQFYY